MWQLLKDAFNQWSEDRPSQVSAALAYFTLFSIAPLLLIAIAIAGLFFGQEATKNQLVGALQGLVGQESAKAVQAMVKNAGKPSSGIVATIVSVVTLLIGATGVVSQLQESLNIVWQVEPKPGRGVMGVIKDRIASFSMILAIGFLLLVSLVVSTVLTAASQSLQGFLPGGALIWRVVDFGLSFGFITLLFAMMYKILPDVRIAWKDVWIGAAITSLLFTIGKFLIGLYLGHSSVQSAYGAAGSLVVLLIWVYYSAQIFLFGAELTQVYTNRYGSGMKPAENAIAVNIPVSSSSQDFPAQKRVTTPDHHFEASQ